MGSKSSNSNKQPSMHISHESSIATNTTFVQANPSNFRAIVQQLTGASSPTASTTSQGGGSTHTAAYKLHERRQQQGAAIRKLEMIKLNNETPNYLGPIDGLMRPRGGSELAMVSPVSTLDGLGLGIGSPSPRNDPRCSLSEEEERVIIAQKGFYLHPVNPLSGGAFRYYEPQLLPLFPLHSPRNGQD